MLRQEIAWFDEERNSTGALITRLTYDASKVHGATGTHLAVLLETIMTLLLSVIVAFVYSWALSLLILGALPVVMLAGIAELKAISGDSEANKKALESAGKVNSEY